MTNHNPDAWRLGLPSATLALIDAAQARRAAEAEQAAERALER